MKKNDSKQCWSWKNDRCERLERYLHTIGYSHGIINNIILPVASLGWVTPGAATEGVTPLFFPEKPGDPFFAHRCHYHYRFLLPSLGCHPLEGITPYLFYLFDLVSPLFFVNLPTKKLFSFGCQPLEGPPLVFPSDATDYYLGLCRPTFRVTWIIIISSRKITERFGRFERTPLAWLLQGFA